MLIRFALVIVITLACSSGRSEALKPTLQAGKTSASVSGKPASFEVPDTEELRAFRERVRKAEAGDPVAQCDVGLTYLVGNERRLGVKKDEAIAESWFLKSAKQGNRNAFSRLRSIHGMRAFALKNKGQNDTEELTEALKFGFLLGNDLSVGVKSISDATKLEAQRRAAQFRLENGLSEPPSKGR
jgi:TPR repeat protein